MKVQSVSQWLLNVALNVWKVNSGQRVALQTSSGYSALKLPTLAGGNDIYILFFQVEKNKMSRVYFADVYKEYEVLHRYVTRLTEKYKNTLQEDKFSNLPSTENGEEPEAEKKKLLKVRCKLVGSTKFYHGFGCCCFDNHVESWRTFFLQTCNV